MGFKRLAGRRLAWMVKPYSLTLCQRVAAVVLWSQRFRTQGDG